jgi:hypothetical protein
LIFVGADHVAPPSVERANQIRLLQLEATFDPGPSPDVQPGSPERSVQTAYTRSFDAVL